MKEIKLLEAQIEKLNLRGFDLKAWKQYTVVILARIFGENDPKIRQIEKIEYDHSSWSLRDTSGSAATMDSCKNLGREILQAAIDELKTFGLPGREAPSDNLISAGIVRNALEEELKVSQLRRLYEIVDGDQQKEKKISAISDFIKTLDKTFPEKVLTEILANEGIKGKLGKTD
jgi:hypothetical protein